MSRSVKKLVNWLSEPISTGALVAIGFTQCEVKKIANNDTGSKEAKPRVFTECGTLMGNARVQDEHLYYAPLDAVAYCVDEQWYLAMDHEFDHVWQGNLNTMGDFIQVLICLSK